VLNRLLNECKALQKNVLDSCNAKHADGLTHDKKRSQPFSRNAEMIGFQVVRECLSYEKMPPEATLLRSSQ